MSLKFTFIDHSDLSGQHALFSPSQSSWLRYDEDQIAERVLTQYRAPIGTEIHEYAAMRIDNNHKVTNIKSLVQSIEEYIYTKYKFLSPNLRVPDYYQKLVENVGLLPREVFETVRSYINDGINFKMTTEQLLVYSDHIYGTTDTISFRENINGESKYFLRIHDLKTGSHKANMEQLATYAALFCLEYGPIYGFKPTDIEYELRLYQMNEILAVNPTPNDIMEIIDNIVRTEKIASKFDKED